MIILTNTTDKIQVSLGATVSSNNLECFCSYRDTTSTSIVAGRNKIVTNNLTRVDLVESPPSSTQRIVDYLSIYNADKLPSFVTIYLNDNSTLYILYSARLDSGDKIEFQNGMGFRLIGNSGSEKIIEKYVTPTINNEFKSVLINKDVSCTLPITFTTIDTGLSFPLKQGKIVYFKAVMFYTVSSTNVGARMSLIGTGGGSIYQVVFSATTTTIQILAGNQTYEQLSYPGTTSAATAGNIGIMEGLVLPGVDGLVKIRFGQSGTAGTITCKAGSFVTFKQLIDA